MDAQENAELAVCRLCAQLIDSGGGPLRSILDDDRGRGHCVDPGTERGTE